MGLVLSGSGACPGLAWLFGYAVDSNATTVAYSGGVTTATVVNAADQVTGISTSSPSATAVFGYTVDKAGLITASSDSLTGTSNAVVGRDGVARVTGSGGDGGYSYSKAGVITAGTGQTDTYNAAGELTGQTQGSDSSVYTYTAAGQRASTALDGTLFDTYTYSRAGALASVKALTTTYAYIYDGDGLRTAAVKTVGKTTSSTAFTWDSQTGSIPELLSDGENDYVYGLGDQVIEQAGVATGAPVFLERDRLGSTRTLTSATGVLVGTYAYSVYGQMLGHTGTVTTPFQFSGEYTDPTGLIYLRARYYDPATAQFLSIDPLVDTTKTAYGYAAGDPLQNTDPFGLDTGFCLFGSSNGRCRGGGVLDDVVSYGPSVSSLNTGVTGDVVGFFEGVGDGATGGLTQHIRDAIDPASECYVNKNGFYDGGEVTGFGAAIVISSGASAETEAAAKDANAVIGKVKDLDSVRDGEYTLLDKLPDRGSPSANWSQNSGVLRQEMGRGVPIRDASVDSKGNLVDDTGFLRAERNLLRTKGWTYDPKTTLWSPGG